MSDGGDDGGLVVDGLSDKLQDLGSEEGYLAASKKRADELKVQYVADEAEEERLAEMKASGEGGGSTNPNYGPGDLGETAMLMNDDSWVDSLGKDEDNIIGAQAELKNMPGQEGAEEGAGAGGDSPLIL